VSNCSGEKIGDSAVASRVPELRVNRYTTLVSCQRSSARQALERLAPPKLSNEPREIVGAPRGGSASTIGLRNWPYR